jgi:hypothetical protein
VVSSDDVPSRKLIAALIAVPLVAGAAWYAMPSSSSSSSDDASTKSTAQAPSSPQAASQNGPALDPRRVVPTLPQTAAGKPHALATDPYAAAQNAPPPQIEPVPTNPKVAEATQDTRSARAGSATVTGTVTAGRRGAEDLPLHANPRGVLDPSVRENANRRRMHSIIDRAACNVPDAQERLAAMSPADRAAWEKRCAKVAPPAPAASLPKTH